MFHEDLFYPKLSRRRKYSGNKGKKTAHYSCYRDEIIEDCEHRCVYCDTTLKEIGYEGMVLDHFRPQMHFPKLTGEPYNLVSSCSKCNRLKWHHWPCKKDIKTPSHDGNIGFVDPFLEERKEYFKILKDGNLEDKKNPAKYMIRLLNLNRNSRVQVRRERIINKEFEEIYKQFNIEFETLLKSLNSKTITLSDAIPELTRLKNVIDSIRLLL